MGIGILQLVQSLFRSIERASSIVTNNNFFSISASSVVFKLKNLIFVNALPITDLKDFPSLGSRCSLTHSAFAQHSNAINKSNSNFTSKHCRSNIVNSVSNCISFQAGCTKIECLFTNYLKTNHHQHKLIKEFSKFICFANLFYSYIF